MKKTEQAWRNILGGGITFTDMSGRDGYTPCTITWDEPEWEEVEVVRWFCQWCNKLTVTDSENYPPECCHNPMVRLTGTYRRRKPEPEPEVWEGEVYESMGKGYGIITEVPYKWIGKRVEVRVLP